MWHACCGWTPGCHLPWVYPCGVCCEPRAQHPTPTLIWAADSAWPGQQLPPMQSRAGLAPSELLSAPSDARAPGQVGRQALLLEGSWWGGLALQGTLGSSVGTGGEAPVGRDQVLLDVLQQHPTARPGNGPSKDITSPAAEPHLRGELCPLPLLWGGVDKASLDGGRKAGVLSLNKPRLGGSPGPQDGGA